MSTVDEADFAKDVAEMVADHAPRLFAIVLEYGTQVDARIAAWGMELDEGAYMTTVDGRRQYALADAEGALRYIRGNPDTTPRLVWVEAPTHG
ncbi:hypothetical protein KIPE111705_29375 [Kibdelosporangium persicum]|uniref:Immunity protein 35 n=1 Tax=Kibdelosporangium persicum TaxID=2698649 RepID=A0ABX2F012_9PSEU|nr:hypothetical protein [Kibdelosporangium persicum]NRN64484.1 hypothetical protein [Kibdelosporangium persicum]